MRFQSSIPQFESFVTNDTFLLFCIDKCIHKKNIYNVNMYAQYVNFFFRFFFLNPSFKTALLNFEKINRELQVVHLFDCNLASKIFD